jgi:hypothetical protein
VQLNILGLARALLQEMHLMSKLQALGFLMRWPRELVQQKVRALLQSGVPELVRHLLKPDRDHLELELRRLMVQPLR